MKIAVAICAGLAVSASASVGPDFVSKNKSASSDVRTSAPAGGLDANFSDNFDSYANGSILTGQGMWKSWFLSPGVDATVTNSGSNSAPNSMRYNGAVFSDMVVEVEITSGTIEFTCMTFMPGNTGQVNDAFIIALNEYTDAGVGTSWSLQTQFHGGFGFVDNNADPATTAQVPLIFDKWIEHKCVADLEANTMDVFYDGVQVGSTVTWYNDFVNPNTNNLANSNWSKKFDAIDMFSNGFDGMLVDDITIDNGGGGCYADCDLSGGLDFFDFLCFQNEFAAATAYADCDNSGGHDFFDFLCFQNAFAAGCP